MYNERREQIRALLQVKPFISIKELESLFPDVSGMTLRRDIEYFESIHEAIKVRGGARSMKFITTQTDGSIATRMTENVRSKDSIAQRAAEFLETGRSIFIDSGSTLQHIVQYVPNDRFTFTTTDPAAALELCKIGMPIVNIVGGRLDHDNQTITGAQATRFLQDINIDIAFLCPSGLSSRSGLTASVILLSCASSLTPIRSRNILLDSRRSIIAPEPYIIGGGIGRLNCARRSPLRSSR